MSSLLDTRLAVIGLGLMGGSLAAALSGRCASLVGCDLDPLAVHTALARGWIHHGTQDSIAAVSQADLVVLASPVRTILHLLDDLAPHFPPGCVVMDLGSTKTLITEKMEALPTSLQPLGGHPMCGKEFSGIQAADPLLYRGQTFILTPLARTAPQALSLATELVEALGAQALILTPQENDHLAAIASHLPFLLSAGLVETARQAAQRDPRLWQVTASGYRDTSRLAASSVTMMTDILLTNRSAVLEALSDCRQNLNHLTELIETAREDELRELLTAIHDSRKEWNR